MTIEDELGAFLDDWLEERECVGLPGGDPLAKAIVRRFAVRDRATPLLRSLALLRAELEPRRASMSWEQLADWLLLERGIDVSRPTLRKLFRVYGWDLERRTPKRDAIQADEAALLQKRRDRGLSTRAVAACTGRDRRTVQRHTHRTVAKPRPVDEAWD